MSRATGRTVTPLRLEIEELWNQGLELKEIAKRTGSSIASISVTISNMRRAPDVWDVPYRYADYDPHAR